MDDVTPLESVVGEISSALRQLAHDRWQLSGLHGGRLWIIADSRRSRLAPGSRCTRVTPLARRCLADRQVVTVSSVWPPEPPSLLRDWEMEWPTLVYVPVATRRRRACGLLIIGARNLHTFDQPDLDYMGDLGEVIAPWVRRFLDDRRPGERRRAA